MSSENLQAGISLDNKAVTRKDENFDADGSSSKPKDQFQERRQLPPRQATAPELARQESGRHLSTGEAQQENGDGLFKSHQKKGRNKRGSLVSKKRGSLVSKKRGSLISKKRGSLISKRLSGGERELLRRLTSLKDDLEEDEVEFEDLFAHSDDEDEEKVFNMSEIGNSSVVRGLDSKTRGIFAKLEDYMHLSTVGKFPKNLFDDDTTDSDVASLQHDLDEADLECLGKLEYDDDVDIVPGNDDDSSYKQEPVSSFASNHPVGKIDLEGEGSTVHQQGPQIKKQKTAFFGYRYNAPSSLQTMATSKRNYLPAALAMGSYNDDDDDDDDDECITRQDTNKMQNGKLEEMPEKPVTTDLKAEAFGTQELTATLESNVNEQSAKNEELTPQQENNGDSLANLWFQKKKSGKRGSLISKRVSGGERELLRRLTSLKDDLEEDEVEFEDLFAVAHEDDKDENRVFNMSEIGNSSVVRGLDSKTRGIFAKLEDYMHLSTDGKFPKNMFDDDTTDSDLASLQQDLDEADFECLGKLEYDEDIDIPGNADVNSNKQESASSNHSADKIDLEGEVSAVNRQEPNLQTEKKAVSLLQQDFERTVVGNVSLFEVEKTMATEDDDRSVTLVMEDCNDSADDCITHQSAADANPRPNPATSSHGGIVESDVKEQIMELISVRGQQENEGLENLFQKKDANKRGSLISKRASRGERELLQRLTSLQDDLEEDEVEFEDLFTHSDDEDEEKVFNMSEIGNSSVIQGLQSKTRGIFAKLDDYMHLSTVGEFPETIFDDDATDSDLASLQHDLDEADLEHLGELEYNEDIGIPGNDVTNSNKQEPVSSDHPVSKIDSDGKDVTVNNSKHRQPVLSSMSTQTIGKIDLEEESTMKQQELQTKKKTAALSSQQDFEGTAVEYAPSFEFQQSMEMKHDDDRSVALVAENFNDIVNESITRQSADTDPWQNSPTASHDGMVEILKKELQDAKVQNGKLVHEKETLSERVANLEAAVFEAQRDKVSLTKNLAALESNAKEQSSTNMLAMSNLEDEKVLLAKKLAAVRSEMSSLKKMFEEESNALNKKISALQKERNSLKEEKSSATQRSFASALAKNLEKESEKEKLSVLQLQSNRLLVENASLAEKLKDLETEAATTDLKTLLEAAKMLEKSSFEDKLDKTMACKTQASPKAEKDRANLDRQNYLPSEQNSQNHHRHPGGAAEAQSLPHHVGSVDRDLDLNMVRAVAVRVNVEDTIHDAKKVSTKTPRSIRWWMFVTILIFFLVLSGVVLHPSLFSLSNSGAIGSECAVTVGTPTSDKAADNDETAILSACNDRFINMGNSLKLVQDSRLNEKRQIFEQEKAKLEHEMQTIKAQVLSMMEDQRDRENKEKEAAKKLAVEKSLWKKEMDRLQSLNRKLETDLFQIHQEADRDRRLADKEKAKLLVELREVKKNVTLQARFDADKMIASDQEISRLWSENAEIRFELGKIEQPESQHDAEFDRVQLVDKLWGMETLEAAERLASKGESKRKRNKPVIEKKSAAIRQLRRATVDAWNCKVKEFRERKNRFHPVHRFIRGINETSVIMKAAITAVWDGDFHTELH